MFLQAHETTINKGFKQRDFVATLTDHILKSRDSYESQFITIQEDKIENFTILGLGDGNFITPKPFTHPVVITVDDHTYLIGDMRTSSKYDKNIGAVKISNAGLFKRDAIRLVMEGLWQNGYNSDIMNIGAFQVQVFSTWVADTIARRYGLNMELALTVRVLTAFYYMCLFTTPEKIDARRMVAVISKATKTNVNYIMSTLQDVEYIGTIQDLLDVFKTKLPSERLSDITLDVFLAMLSGSWFGPNHSVLVGTAVEYPPLWVTLLYLSMSETINRSTGIGKTALKYERDPVGREFLAATSRLLMDNITIDIKTARG